jgi:hypothetical protein
MTTVTGISDHIGWAETVTLSVRGGTPVILDRRRLELIGPGLASAPYHHECLELPPKEAARLVGQTRASVVERCRRAVDGLRSSLGAEAVVIRKSPYDAIPDSLSEVLASRALTCAADGMLYREELAFQAAALGLAVHRFPRKSDPLAEAATTLGVPTSTVAALLSGFGKAVGAPWRKEHKDVAAAALLVLAANTNVRS